MGRCIIPFLITFSNVMAGRHGLQTLQLAIIPQSMDGRLWNEPDRTSFSRNRVCTPHRTAEEWMCSRNGWIRIAHRRRDRHASLFSPGSSQYMLSCSLDLGDLWRPRSPILSCPSGNRNRTFLLCHLYPFDILGTFLILSRLARSRAPSRAPLVNKRHA